MTLTGLESELDELGANLQIHLGFHAFVVWLYAADDPEFLYQAAGPSLEACIADVISQWRKLAVPDTELDA